MRIVILLALSLAVASAATGKAPALPSLSQSCELVSRNRFLFQYAHCEDTTDYRSFNLLLSLRLEKNPDFDKYRRYRTWERPVKVVTSVAALAFMGDFALTRISRGLCIESFNPNCVDEDRITSLLPWQAYAISLGVTVPLHTLLSIRRMRYQDKLVAVYNQARAP